MTAVYICASTSHVTSWAMLPLGLMIYHLIKYTSHKIWVFDDVIKLIGLNKKRLINHFFLAFKFSEFSVFLIYVTLTKNFLLFCWMNRLCRTPVKMSVSLSETIRLLYLRRLDVNKLYTHEIWHKILKFDIFGHELSIDKEKNQNTLDLKFEYFPVSLYIALFKEIDIW